MKTVIMICTGNICRSPMAEGLLRDYLHEANRHDIRTDSAGIENYHRGQKPDTRAIKVMRHHGHDISGLRARQLTMEDTLPADNILMVATDEHLRAAEQLKARANGKAQIVKMLATHPERTNQDLHDPYYGDERDFETTYEQLSSALKLWLNAHSKH